MHRMRLEMTPRPVKLMCTVSCIEYLKLESNYTLRKALFIKRKNLNLKVFFQAKMVFILGIEFI